MKYTEEDKRFYDELGQAYVVWMAQEHPEEMKGEGVLEEIITPTGEKMQYFRGEHFDRFIEFVTSVYPPEEDRERLQKNAERLKNSEWYKEMKKSNKGEN